MIYFPLQLLIDIVIITKIYPFCFLFNNEASKPILKLYNNRIKKQQQKSQNHRGPNDNQA